MMDWVVFFFSLFLSGEVFYVTLACESGYVVSLPLIDSKWDVLPVLFIKGFPFTCRGAIIPGAGVAMATCLQHRSKVISEALPQSPQKSALD